jgi:hypothetical protein
MTDWALPTQLDEQPEPQPQEREYYLPGLGPTLSNDELLERARQRHAGEEEMPGEYIARRLPFSGLAIRVPEVVSLNRARARLESGEPEPGDFDTIARAERRDRRHARDTETFGGALAEEASHIPAMLGEMFVAGPLIRGATGLAGAGARAIGTGRIGGAVAGALGGGATMAATMPSFGVPEGIAEGRGTQAFVQATAQGAILGSIGRLMNAAIPGAGLARGAARMGAGGVIFPAEQQAADAALSGVDDLVRDHIGPHLGISTGYGTLGQLLGARQPDGSEGKPEQGLRRLAIQAIMGTAFAGMHEIQHGNLLDSFGRASRDLQRQGLSEAGAATEIDAALQRAIDEVRSGRQSRVDVTATGETKPSRPVDQFAAQMADAAKEAERRAAEPKPETKPPKIDMNDEALSVVSSGRLTEAMRGSPLETIYERAVEAGYPRDYSTLTRAVFVGAAERMSPGAMEAEFARHFPLLEARPTPPADPPPEAAQPASPTPGGAVAELRADYLESTRRPQNFNPFMERLFDKSMTMPVEEIRALAESIGIDTSPAPNDGMWLLGRIDSEGRERIVRAERGGVISGPTARAAAPASSGLTESYSITSGGTTAGEIELGRIGSPRESQAARAAFPNLIGPNETVSRIHGIEIHEPHRGKGLGQKLYLKGMKQHKADWYYNSQAEPGAVNALNALARKGLIEIHWKEPGGAHLVRLRKPPAAPPEPARPASRAPEAWDDVRPMGERLRVLKEDPRYREFDDYDLEHNVLANLSPEQARSMTPDEARQRNSDTDMMAGMGMYGEAGLPSPAETARARTGAAEPPRTMESLRQAEAAGEPVRLEEVARAAGLDARELHVLKESQSGRKYDDIATDQPMRKKDGSPLTRARVEQLYNQARAKLGDTEGLLKKKKVTKDAAAENRAALKEGAVPAKEANAENRDAPKRAVDQYRQAQDALERLNEDIVRKMEDGTATPAAQAAYEAEAARLVKIMQEVENRSGRKQRKPKPDLVHQGTEPPNEATDATIRKVVDDFVRDESGTLNIPKVEEFAAKTYEKLKKGYQHLQDNAGQMAGEMFPRLTRMSRVAGEKASRFVSADGYAEMATPEMIDRVLGPGATEADRKLVGAVLTERRLRYARAVFETFGDAERAGNVRSMIGASTPEGEIYLPSEQAYQEALNSPRVQEAIKRWKDSMVPVMEDNFRRSQGIEPDEMIQALTQIPGEPINLRAISMEADVTPSTVFFGTSRGNLKNTRLHENRFAREFKGSADAYDVDLGAIIRGSLGVTKTAAKADWFRQMVADGDANFGRPGVRQEGWREIPNVRPPKGTQNAGAGDSSIYVRDAIYKEVRQALAVDEPWKIDTFKAAADLATKATLASTIEAAYHSKNLLTFLFKPGVNWADAARNVYKDIRRDPAYMRRIVELAEIGAMKTEGSFETGVQYSSKNPLTWMGNFLHLLQRSMRVTADQAFDRLARRGAVNTETNRRNFINQLGQYNKLAQHRIIVALRDLGVGPFATAGSNYWMQGLRALKMDPGVKAETTGAAISFRAEMLARSLAVLSAVGVANYLAWGRVDGDDDTPIGSIRLGREGARLSYFDALNFTGMTRGARQLGLLSVAEGIRRNESTSQIVNRGTRQVIQSGAHPAVGPVLHLGWTVATGKDTTGRRIAANPPGNDDIDIVQNIIAAAMHANPVISSVEPEIRNVFGMAKSPHHDTLSERLWRNLGPYAPKVRTVRR